MKKVLILGNGKSRLRQYSFLKNWDGEIWVCNNAYTEYPQYPQITRVGTVHSDLVSKMNIYKLRNKIDFEIWVKNNKNLKAKAFTKYRGWSTGNELIQQALIEDYDKILLAGFDFGGRDIYQPNNLIGSNFTKQFNRLKEEYDCINVYWLNEQNKEIQVYEMDVSTKKGNKTKPDITINTKNFKDKKCIIVGNGYSLCDTKLGEEIDKFPIAVRINDYYIKGFESYTGEKTDLWFSGIGNQTKIKRKYNPNIKQFAIFPINMYNYGLEFLKQKIGTRIGYDQVKNFCIINKEEIKKLIHICNIEYPSTGIMTILYCKHILGIKDITICGFDFFESGLHYYDSQDTKIRISDEHSFDKEKEFIRNMIEKGELNELCINNNAK